MNENIGKDSRISVVRIAVTVLIIAIVGLILLGIFGLIKANGMFQRISQENAESALGTMTWLGELPWQASEYQLQAVVICQGSEEPIFIESNVGFDADSIENCGYYTAKSVEVRANSNFFSETGKIKFVSVE